MKKMVKNLTVIPAPNPMIMLQPTRIYGIYLTGINFNFVFIFVFNSVFELGSKSSFYEELLESLTKVNS